VSATGERRTKDNLHDELAFIVVGEAKMSLVCSKGAASHELYNYRVLEKQRCLSCAGSGPWRERRCLAQAFVAQVVLQARI